MDAAIFSVDDDILRFKYIERYRDAQFGDSDGYVKADIYDQDNVLVDSVSQISLDEPNLGLEYGYNYVQHDVNGLQAGIIYTLELCNEKHEPLYLKFKK